MMKRNIKFFAYLLGITLLSNACTDSFLDEEVLDKYAPESLKDELGLDAAAIGLHDIFGEIYSYSNDQSYPAIWVFGTDVVWAPVGRYDNFSRPYFDYDLMISTDAGAALVWRLMYRIINNANLLVQTTESGETIGIAQERLDAFNAEARFFRAYSYNMLATLFGDVPLVTDPISSVKTDFVRTPIEEVNNAIVDDLLLAIENLSMVDDLEHKARIHQAVARQLLAEVYLRIGQNDLAEAQCSAIINGESGIFSLITGRFGVKSGAPGDAFSDMFHFGNQRRNEGNTETIWTLEQENPEDVAGGGLGNPQQRRVWGGAYHDLPGMSIADTLGGRGLTRVRLNNWVLYDLYGTNDMRNSKYNIHRQLYFNNPDERYNEVYGEPVPYGQDAFFILNPGEDEPDTLKIFASDTIYKNVPYTLKWGQFDSRDEFGFGMRKDFIVMRLAETYLLRAEARFKQGDLVGAAADINVLRARAQADLVTAGDMTLDFILDERVRELIGEENRRMTLVRTRTLVERARRLNGTGSLADGAIETTNGLQDFHMLLPIPQDEIDLNKDAVLEQNFGYN